MLSCNASLSLSCSVLFRLLLIASLVAANPAACTSKARAASSGWNLVWSDEFESSSLDTNKWEPILWTTPFNNEQQAYHPSRVTVSGGNLMLTADDADFGGKSYTSGKVKSKWAQQYGRWENSREASGHSRYLARHLAAARCSSVSLAEPRRDRHYGASGRQTHYDDQRFSLGSESTRAEVLNG